MLSWGARVNTEVYNGMALLMIAAEDGDVAMVDVLLEGGASINDMNREGSAQTLAVRNNHDSVIERLLAAGADVNIDDCGGHTLLMWCQDEEFGALMLDHGADMYQTDGEGGDAIMWACKRGFTNMLSLYKNRGTVFTTSRNMYTGFMYACENGHVDIVT
jgi:ankyrin repeat protein